MTQVCLIWWPAANAGLTIIDMSTQQERQAPNPWPQAPPEIRLEQYTRQTRNAVTVIAWIVGLFAAVSVVVGIIAGVQLAKVQADLNNGTTPGCISTISTGC